MNSDRPSCWSQGEMNQPAYEEVSSQGEKRRRAVFNPYVKSKKISKASSDSSSTINISESTSTQTFTTRAGKFTVSKSSNHNSQSNANLWNNETQHISPQKHPLYHTNGNPSLHQNLASVNKSSQNTSFVSNKINEESSSSKTSFVKDHAKPKIANPYSRQPRHTYKNGIDGNRTKYGSMNGKKNLLSDNEKANLEKNNFDKKCSALLRSTSIDNTGHKAPYSKVRKNPYLNSNSIQNTKIRAQKPSNDSANHQTIGNKCNISMPACEENKIKISDGAASNSYAFSRPTNIAARENEEYSGYDIDWESIDLKSVQSKASLLSFKKVNKKTHETTSSCGVIHRDAKIKFKSIDKSIGLISDGIGGIKAEVSTKINKEKICKQDNSVENTIIILDSDDEKESSFSNKNIQKKISYLKSNEDHIASTNNDLSSKSAISKNGFTFPDPCTKFRHQIEHLKGEEKLDNSFTNNSINTEKQTKMKNIKENSSSAPSKSLKEKASVKLENMHHLPPLPKELIYDFKRIRAIDDDKKRELIKNANLSGTLSNGWKLLPHQKQGILRALLMRRLVLAFDMGLGKTLIACVWAKSFQKTYEYLKVFIVSPVSLKKEWGKTATEATGLRVENHETSKKKNQKPKRKVRDKKIQDIENDFTDSESENSEHDLDTKLTPGVEICSWAKIPINISREIERYVVIFDEAHSMQNMESSRTKNALKLIDDKRCEGVLLLTGTPMKNGKPSNLFPLLKAVRHPFGDNQKRYETFFCNGQQRQVGPTNKCIWDASGSSNLGVLNAHVSSHVFHKTKDACLKELPPKSREYKKVPISSRYELKYTNALNEFAKIKNSDFENKQCKTEVMLDFISKIRLIAACAKIDATVALAKSILCKESSIVIFTTFVRVAKDLHNKLASEGWGGELMTGETPPAKRQSMVDNFQEGISPVFICTFGVGGVGLTLTAACTIILVDRPWTPGDTLQAEDRVRRIGQTRPVKSIWMRALDFDEKLDDMLEHKNKNSKAVVDKYNADEENSYNNSKTQPKVPIFELMNAVVSSTSLSSPTEVLNLKRDGQEHAGFFAKKMSPD